MDEDIPLPFDLPAVARKKVSAAFDGGRITSDGGVMLLAQAERRLGIADQLARVIPDERDASRVTHLLPDILRARIFAIACGWAKLDRAQCRIVTRFKSNTPLHVVEDLPVPAAGGEGGGGAGAILSGRIGHLPRRQSNNRANPFQDPVREVRVKLDTGKVLRILCNDLDASAPQIADLYKRRWAIELFFRWIKQTLKIRRFLGTSENAIRIQIAVALIAFVLLRLAQAAQDTINSPLRFAQLVRDNLMQRGRLDRLLACEPPTPYNPAQIILQWHAA